MGKILMKGAEAIGEAAIRAGCRFFSGYPITPQSEVLEYLSWRMPEVGGTFVQSESELSGISMVYGAASTGIRAMTSSSGPGFTLLNEGISYIASAELPCVIADIQRYGSGLGEIFVGQSDYWMTVKNGGHSDYRTIVYAPSSVQETIDLMVLAFDKAEEHRGPVILLSDASLAQMMEPAELPPVREHNMDAPVWAMKGKGNGKHKCHTSLMYYKPDFDQYIAEKYRKIEETEQRSESIKTEDADLVLVAYGISARICEEAVEICRERGKKVGLLRPISLYPFPSNAFAGLAPKFGWLCVEMTMLAQMTQDVATACKMKQPVYDLGGGVHFFDADEVVQMIERVYEGKAREVWSV
jgi:2-oxoglutarate ferredoxin oxidoreductase subunit alpha